MTDLVNNTNTVDERTRAFFERNLQVRNKLQNETRKQVEKRTKLREEFGTESHLFDSWRNEQESSTDTSNRNPPVENSRNGITIGPTDTLLATNIAAVQISNNSNSNCPPSNTTTNNNDDDKTEKNEE